MTVTRWKNGETEFSVKLADDEKDSIVCRISKPIVDRPRSSSGIRFVMDDKKITVEAVNKK